MNDFVIENLPFGVGCFSEADKSLPAFLPFQLHFDETNGLMYQKLGDESRVALKLYYLKGGYASTPLGEGDYGQKQGEELFLLIKNCLTVLNRKITELSFLEIGASYGYLLHLLKEAGAKDVVGLEPGNEGVSGGQKYGVQLIKDFFPSKNLVKKFDFIFSYAVLEHIDDPVSFVKAMFDQLEDDGIIFIGVPDCTKKMNLGDASIISHQHINYFTRNSLEKLMINCGLADVTVVESQARSLLTGFGVKKSDGVKEKVFSISQDDMAIDKRILENFRINFKKNLASLQSLINQYESDGQSIGFYAPGQSIVGLLKMKQAPRIFDGDAFKTGKYINGCTSAFESLTDLIARPVDVLFVCSIDYDREIFESLIAAGLDSKNTELISLKKIYESNSGVAYDVGSLKNAL